MILFPFFATLTLPVVSDRRPTKCSLIRFRSYRPELNPRTGTWSHHSWILMRCAFGSISTSSGMNAARTLVRMFFPRRPSSSMNLRTRSAGFFSQMCVGSRSRVSPTLTRDWHVCVFNREHACRLLPLILIPVRFKIVQDRVWEALRLRPWQLHIYFPYFTRACLDYMEASSSERFCVFYSCFKPAFSCLVIVSNDFITIVRVTFSASVPVTAVVLKYSPRFMVVPVDRSALNPLLTAVPACRGVNVNFPPRRFLFEPAKRFWRSCMF